MAIDSAEKLRSAAGVGFWVVGPGVTPNASKDAEWRQQAGWGYSGIAAAEPSADATILRAVTLTGRQAARAATGIQPAHDLKGRQPASTGTGKV